jgi:hypothetical protein
MSVLRVEPFARLVGHTESLHVHGIMSSSNHPAPFYSTLLKQFHNTNTSFAAGNKVIVLWDKLFCAAAGEFYCAYPATIIDIMIKESIKYYKVNGTLAQGYSLLQLITFTNIIIIMR